VAKSKTLIFRRQPRYGHAMAVFERASEGDTVFLTGGRSSDTDMNDLVRVNVSSVV
jgi:hypothetical protein